MTEKGSLSCERCGVGIECCAFCQETGCGAAICDQCLNLELGMAMEQPHAHGG
jgi:hypothetical protein